jgi:FHA domain-containing protein
MLKLEVIHYKGAVPPHSISAQFEAAGGTIGRSDGNTLVLPDADRFISRTHARIKFQQDRYLIEDHGSSTPVMLNGRPLGKGTEAALAHSDELTIGEYSLRAIVQLSVPAAAGRTSAATMEDPMAMFGSPAGADPFGDLIPRAAASAAPAIAAAAPSQDPFGLPPQRAGGAIPDDFDPFSNLGRSADPAPALDKPAAPGTSAAAFGVTPSPSLDSLFGLGPASSSDPFGAAGPLSTSAESSPIKGAPSLDPLDAFRDTPVQPAAPTQRNDAPVLSDSFLLPKAMADPALARPAAVTPPARSEPDTPRPAPALADMHIETVEDAMAATQRVAVVRHGADALVSAFLQGAGIANLNLPSGMTPQTMHMLGEVLRETVQAMLDLLLARAMLKRELRAEVTMIVARENNPLKFSPNVETALGHLLAPQRGYMQPLEAVKDACNDLRSNQFAFMAGMRAALAGVLKRFNPEQLEKRLKQKSMIESLLPGSRKAKMWDLFSDLYQDVSKEAEDDFHELFGREFLRAYEAQVAKLARQDGDGERRQ